MNILDEIWNYKKKFVNKLKQEKPLDDFKSLAYNNYYRPNNYFLNYLLKNSKNNMTSIIGEVKRASPSAGKLANFKNIYDIAKEYYNIQEISCASVLTDEKYFNGSIDDLVFFSQKFHRPILRKDFIVDEYQIYETKVSLGHCILLIATKLKDKEIEHFSNVAKDIGLDVILEIHSKDEAHRANNTDIKMVGINNRNLADFSVTLSNCVDLASILKNKLVIGESGIKTREDIQFVRKNSEIKTFLIGESLMKAKNRALFAKNLTK